jgi:hypothetical protein
MMLTFEEAEKVWYWYCGEYTGDEYTKRVLKTIGLISTDEDGTSGTRLISLMPAISYLKVVDSKRWMLAKIEHGF